MTDTTIASRTAEIDGIQLHYLTAGHGPPLVLLHGYAETSLMWKPLLPKLAERFTVIAPDLPGMVDSAIPAEGLDMQTSAIRVPRACPLAWRREGPGGRTRHWLDGRLRLCCAVPGRGGEACGDGCLPAGSGRVGVHLQPLRLLAFPIQRFNPRKSWSADANAFTSIICGTI